VSAFGDRRLIGQAGAALLLANVRFWSTVAPLVDGQLKRWKRHARTINDPALRALALEKLAEEGFNSEVAATLATLVPRAHREHVVEAIVAYEVMYDYLDGLTEQPAADPLGNGHQLYQAFIDAIALSTEPQGGYYASNRQQDDSGYLEELVKVVRRALAQLPSAGAIAQASERAATRCAEAQIRAHAVPLLGTAQLERWAAGNAAGSSLGWREFLAGSASSVLAVHALIAAAADVRTTPAEAREIDTVYLSICALSTMLDSLVDHERDEQAGQSGYVRYYEDHDLLAGDLVRAARHAAQHAALLRNGAHHFMTLVGVASYYASAPDASSEFAQPVTQRIRRELEPLITPTLAVMRVWRIAKRIRRGPSLSSSASEMVFVGYWQDGK
jgi:tetraprenyl-beta-curcumene synthase